MPVLTREITINSSSEAVYDLVSDVLNFSDYSSYIKSIKRLPSGEYRWKVEMLGVEIGWDAEIVEDRRPVRFAWRSTRGVFNAGSYELEPADGGTLVRFRMEYSVTGTALEELLAPLLNRLISNVSNELIENIKKRLER